MKRVLVLIGVVAVILAACAVDPSHPEESREYAVIPLARFVLPEDYDSQDGMARIEDGTLTFNEQYRIPDLPRDRVSVRCEETDRIGVAFNLTRRNSHSGRAVTIRETWTHSEVDIEGDDLDQTRRIGLESGREARLMNVSLNLTPATKVDGVWALRVAINDEVLFRDSFELTGCGATPSARKR